MIRLAAYQYNVREIFSSVQGEGPYVGYRQIFLRFCNCNLRCQYCDTDFLATEYCRVETTPGKRDFSQIKNPLSSQKIISLIDAWKADLHHSVSFTGGEPLLAGENLRELMAEIKKKHGHLKIFLETNGTLPEKLAQVIDLVDIVSMDLKLPSLAGQNLFQAHAEFINKALSKDLYVKIVVTQQTSDEEFLAAVDLLRKFKRDIPLIIQPVTARAAFQMPTAERQLSFQELALQKLSQVRIIPQTHSFIDQL